MITQTLQEKAAKLRQAVVLQDYQGLQTVLEEYRRQFDAELAMCPPGDARALKLASESEQLIGWALAEVRSNRAQKARELDSISGILGYCAGRPRRAWWEVKA